jgi:hypothetical protein
LPKKERESASAKSSAKERESASTKRKKKRVPSSDVHLYNSYVCRPLSYCSVTRGRHHKIIVL